MRYLQFALLAIFLFVSASPVWAAIFTVDSTDDDATATGCDDATPNDCSLRGAIIKANATAGADTINLPAGIYTLTFGSELTISEGLTLAGAGADTTIIQAAIQPDVANFRVFFITSGNVAISGVTIQHGNTISNGGGIFVGTGTTLTLTNSAITGNTASLGGGIFIDRGTVTLLGNTIADNTASNQGGGIYMSNFLGGGGATLSDNNIIGNTALFEGGGIALSVVNATLTGNIVMENLATSGLGGGISVRGGNVELSANNVSGNIASGGFGDGGGMFIFSGVGNTYTLASNVVVGNTASGRGGGIWIGSFFGTVTLSDNTIAGNTASSEGGGIHISQSINRGTLSGNTITRNTASNGGGIWYSDGGTLTLTNNTVSGNMANSNGGGIFMGSGTLNLNNVTITNNTADDDGDGTGDGGGIRHDLPTAVVNIKNTIIAGNTDRGGETPDCSGTLTSQGHNLVGSDTGCTIVGDTTGNIIGVYPNLGPLEDNGGPTQTHALLAGSPAIDTGNPDPPGSGGNTCEGADQRGVARPQGAACDMGAFEASDF